MATYILIRLMFVAILIGVGNAQNPSSCTNLSSIISTVVGNAVQNNSRVGAFLLRLHFHDCFVNGCDASVLLDDTTNFTGEKAAGPNLNSLRGFDVIDTIKTQVEAACPGVVSCADILAVAARDGVVALGGPTWTVALGRSDSTTASQSAANTQIPGPGSNLTTLISMFSNKGFIASEMVALSGSHTIGFARCTTFRNRIYSESNINATFANLTQQSCPSNSGDNNPSPLDSSPTAFNNDYFTNLLGLNGLLHSDQELFSNGSTDAQVRTYASSMTQFATDFANAMVKMSNLSPTTNGTTEIRRNCRRTN